jgi:predicted enzyme related to lactoylglutathione lyase
MAVLQDPQGAFFLVWQPRNHFGSALVNAPGALSWNELASPDLDASMRFYGELFGWTFEEVPGMQARYLSIKNRGATNGGIRELSPPDAPPHWLVYFGAEEIEAALARVAELGGSKLAGPIDIGIAKFGVVQDPQGATFALYAGQFES